MTQLRAHPAPRVRPRSWNVAAIFVIGVILIPTLLSILCNSWSAPDAGAVVRMAFATVAGQTIAVATVIGLLVAMIRSRADRYVMAVWIVLAATIIFAAAASVSNASGLLLQRLELVG